MKLWHNYRLRKLRDRLAVVEADIPILQKAEREYASSYYTDEFRSVVLERIELQSAIKYHESKL